MSLGLDALNKLQQLRAQDDVGQLPAIFPPPRIPAKPAKSPVNRWLAAGMVVSLGVAAAALVRSGGKSSDSSGAPLAAAPAPQLHPAPMAVAPVTIIVPSNSPFNQGPGGRTTPDPAGEDATSTLDANVASITRLPVNDSAAPLVAPSPPSSQAASGNPLVTSFIFGIKVGGVDDGSTGQRPLAMLNDSICHLNDTVNVALGVRLVGIQSSHLTFQDARGVVYIRNLFPL